MGVELAAKAPLSARRRASVGGTAAAGQKPASASAAGQKPVSARSSSLRSQSPAGRAVPPLKTRSVGGASLRGQSPGPGPRSARSLPGGASERSGSVQPRQAPAAENVVAAVRVRGFLQREIGRGDELCIRMRSSTTEIQCPRRGKQLFTFDHCFWSMNDDDVPTDDTSYAGQEDVYRTLGVPLVENALRGFNSAIIAYGQTGSGKSYSIFGPPEMHERPELEGLIPRVCKELFKRIQNAPKGTTYTVTASMIEIYMEKVYDLLNNRNQLTIRGDLNHGFSVPGRARREVRTYSRVEHLLQCGDERKTFARTELNERSSRAHTMFELEIRATTDNMTTTTSKVTLCDLAGSERCKDAGTAAGGKEFTQACQINMSLLCLGKCVESVVTSRPGALVTEFRNAALTKLLKDSIGGNSKTIILTTISPSAFDSHTTMLALRFADRAKQIQNHAVINEDTLWEAKIVARVMQQIEEEKHKHRLKERELDKQQHELEESKRRLEEECGRLQTEKREIDEHRNKLMANRQLSDADRRRLAQREADLSDRLKLVHLEHEQLLDRALRLEDENRDYYAEKQEAIRKKEHLEAEVAFLQAQVENLKKDLEDVTGERDDDKAEEARRQGRELARQREQHQRDLDNLKRRFNEERKAYVTQMVESVSKVQNDMQGEKDRAKEKERAWSRSQAEFEATVQSLTAELDRAKRELSESRRRQAELEADAESRSLQVAGLSADLSTKSKESELIQDQLSDAHFGQEAAKKRFGVLYEELEHHKDEAERLRAEHDKVLAVVNEMRRQVRAAAALSNARNKRSVELAVSEPFEVLGVQLNPGTLEVTSATGRSADSGIRSGMRVVAVGGQPVASDKDLRSAIAAQRGEHAAGFARVHRFTLPPGGVAELCRQGGAADGMEAVSVEGEEALLYAPEEVVCLAIADGATLQSAGVTLDAKRCTEVAAVEGKASEAGVESGMILVSLDGERPVADARELAAPIKARAALLFRCPSEQGDKSVQMTLGRDETLEDAGLVLTTKDGCVVMVTHARGAAQKAGVVKGARLVSVDGRLVRSDEEAAQAVRCITLSFSDEAEETEEVGAAEMPLAKVIGKLSEEVRAEGNARVAALRAEHAAELQAERERWEKEVTHQTACIKRLTEDHDGAVLREEERRESIHHKNIELQAKLDEKEDALQQEKRELHRLEDQVRELREDCVATAASRDEAKQRADSAEEEAAQARRDLDKEFSGRERYTADLRSKEDKIADLEGEKDKLEQSYASLASDNNNLQDENDRLREQIDQLSECAQQKEEWVEVSRSAAANHEEEKEALHAKLEDTRVEAEENIKQAREEADAAKREMERVRPELHTPEEDDGEDDE
eukprot:Hpha_TRINITY_DN15669_c3_g1::TRINITY_DN15669_c3_g1_i5::g.99818::m.99818/K17914/KIF13; kinesin family member 13